MCLRMVLGVRAVSIYIVPADVLQSSGCTAGGEARSRRRLIGRGVNGGVGYNFGGGVGTSNSGVEQEDAGPRGSNWPVHIRLQGPESTGRIATS